MTFCRHKIYGQLKLRVNNIELTQHNNSYDQQYRHLLRHPTDKNIFIVF